MGGDRTPNFLVAGVGKAGTTSLHRYLAAHPEVCMTDPKETSFWFEEAEYREGLEYYVGTYLSHCSDGAIRGEANPALSAGDVAKNARRVHALLPDVRLVFLLRDPVERAFSLWWHRRCLGEEDRSFAEAAEPDSPYVREGEYLRILETWASTFGRGQLEVVYSEEFFTDTERIVRELCAALRVSRDVRLPTQKRYNVSWNDASVARLVSWLADTGAIDLLPEAILDLGRSLLSRVGQKPDLPEDVADNLRAYYERRNAGLAELVGRPPPWTGAA